MLQLHRLTDKAIAITHKILLLTMVFVLVLGFVGGYIFGFWDFFTVLKYDIAMKAGNGKSALFWIQRSFSMRYYVIGPDEHYRLGKCYELAGEYEKALDQYRLYLYYEPHFPVRLDICRLYYKMGKNTEAFHMYRKLLFSMSKEDARFASKNITGFTVIDEHLSPFKSTIDFCVFMNSEYQKCPEKSNIPYDSTWRGRNDF